MTLRLLLLFALTTGAAHAQILVHGALARDREATAGDIYDEVVTIHNTSDVEQQARLYLTDYRFAADGTNGYDAPGSLERSNASWISFAPPILTLPPGETLPITISIRVPPGTAAGSYWSMLMVESVPRTSAESTLGDSETVRYGLQERVRYGVQIATHLGAPSTEVEVLDSQLVADDDGARQLAVDVENTGTRMLDGPVYLDVFAPDGTARGRIEGSSARIYPGTSFRHRVDLGTLPAGTYQALLVIDGGAAGVFASQYTLDL